MSTETKTILIRAEVPEGDYKPKHLYLTLGKMLVHTDKVGHQDEVERFRHRVNWKRSNLVIITMQS